MDEPKMEDKMKFCYQNLDWPNKPDQQPISYLKKTLHKPNNCYCETVHLIPWEDYWLGEELDINSNIKF